jgi:3-oxoacyl-[acyl-carrier protein] reductase
MSQEVILVTGGSRGIGAEIARQLASPCRIIIVNYRSAEAPAREVVSAIRASGNEAHAIRGDVSSETEVKAMFEEIKSRWQRLDALVLNAAPALVLESVLKAGWGHFQEQIDVQVKGGLLCSQSAIKLMKERRTGQIVCVLSAFVNGKPASGFASYITAKHALLGLMRSVGTESIRFGIRVNMVSPSMNRTELLASLPEKILEISSERNPLGRLCTPSDVAATVKFLLTEAASFIHLAKIPVTGGEEG